VKPLLPEAASSLNEPLKLLQRATTKSRPPRSFCSVYNYYQFPYRLDHLLSQW